MSSASDLAQSTLLSSDSCYVDVINVTASATPFVRPLRAIRAKVAGTITLTTFAGNSVVCEFAAGETRRIGATAITAATATGIEGML